LVFVGIIHLLLGGDVIRLIAGAHRRTSLLLLASVASLSLTCSDDAGPIGANDTVVSGRAFAGGPITDAEVVVYQIETASGLRRGERGRGRTDAGGTFEISLGGTLNSVEIDVIGGSYVDTSTGATVQRGPAVLHGVAFDLTIAEKRADVAVTPWSHLVYALGESRASVAEEAGRLPALKHARELFTAHLGFDPTQTAIASLTAVAPSATPEVKHALSLAGLSTMAGIAQDDGFADVTVGSFVDVLDVDARSAEHLFDGNGDRLSVTAGCTPPPGCGTRGPGCYASCAVSAHALRAHLGNGIRAYLRAHTETSQTAATLSTWLEGIRTNAEPLLFPAGPAERFDSIGPHIAWITPATDATMVAGPVAIEVVADDPSGVASLSVLVEGAGLPIADTDPSPGRFVGTLDTTLVFDGIATLRATAVDGDGNSSGEPPRTIDINNLLFGTGSGTVVVNGKVAATAVRFYRFDTGVRGALLGEGTTGLDGNFGNVQLADGYSGPLLVEAGGSGTYREDAAPAGAPPVALDVTDTLRTIVPNYTDGAAVAMVVVSPLTTFAVSYFGYLRGPGTDGVPVADRWRDASVAIETHFGVANIRTIVPLSPDQMGTLTAAARYGLDLVGLSQTAYNASTQGGGDGGSFPAVMNTLRIVRVLEADISDGCWDGAHGAPLLFGGTQAPTEDTTRRGLANAIVAYLDDGARNQTPFGGAADVLSLLDDLAHGSTAAGSCVGGAVFDDAGGVFDQQAPTITISPGDGAVVGGVVPVTATASDTLDTRPSLSFTAPIGTVDLDSDSTDSDATANLSTLPLVPTSGPLVVSLESTDDSGNRGTKTVTWQVDNVAPVVTIGGVVEGAWYGGPITPIVTSTDAHPMSFTLTLDGVPFTSGTPVVTEGRHVLMATARDLVGNVTMRTVTFFVDLTAPTLALASTAPPTWIRNTLTLQVIASDTMMMFGSLGTDVVVTASGPSGSVTVAPVAMTLIDGRRQLDVSINTLTLGDGALSVRFDIVDRAGHPATTLELARTIDNTPPTITLAPVHNVGGTVINGYINETTATITGTVPMGGSPVTVTVTASPAGGTGMVAPNASGGFAFTTAGLPEGTITIAASATDAAGNTAAAAPATFVVDRTGPTLTLAQSSVLDERRCDSTFAISLAPATYGNLGPTPVTYNCPVAPPRRLDNATAATEVGKVTSRMTANPTDNPLVWLPTANDGTGVGLDVAPTTIQFEVFRTSTFPVGSWADSVGPTVNNGLVSASLYPTLARWPELAAHTAPFSIYIRARDRLGNLTASPTFVTWTNRPLAPPVWVRYVGLADATDPDLGAFSLFRHSLVPVTGQIGLASAISSGGLLVDAPRGLYEFEIWNPHAQPINVGFFLPAFNGATYVSTVYEVNPYITGTNGIVSRPAFGFCGWDSATTSFRMTGGTGPFTCGSGTTCSCFTPAAPQPVDRNASLAPQPFTNAQLSFAAWDVTAATPVRLFRQSITPTVNGYPFHEFVVPARPTATRASHVRVLVALPNLDLWTPSADPHNEAVVESDGVGSEMHYWEIGSFRYAPVMTAVFYERWADCRYEENGRCNALHARRRLRATVKADITVPSDTLRPSVRSRSTTMATAVPESLPQTMVRDGELRASAPVTWTSCENDMSAGCPRIPDMQSGTPF